MYATAKVVPLQHGRRIGIKEIQQRGLSRVTCFRCKRKCHFMNKCPNILNKINNDKHSSDSNAFNVVFPNERFKATIVRI